MDAKTFGVLQDIRSALQDLVWKSRLDTWSMTESVDEDREVSELREEKEEQEKKASEKEVESTLSEVLFSLDDVNQTLQE